MSTPIEIIDTRIAELSQKRRTLGDAERGAVSWERCKEVAEQIRGIEIRISELRLVREGFVDLG